jgi:hypothetical protein
LTTGRTPHVTRAGVLAAITVAIATVLVVPATAGAEPRAIPAPAIPGAASRPGPVAPAAKPAANMKILKASPDQGFVGTKFTLEGSGLPANKAVQIHWSTADVAYMLNANTETVDWWGRQYSPYFVVLATGRTDGDGNLKLSLSAPRDYGEIHDIYAVIDGVQVAKGGFRIARRVTVTPKSGPIGTLITIRVSGFGWRAYEGTAAVLYDNKYTGFITSVTTRGETVARIRAAGPVGRRAIEVVNASAAVPYLAIEQSALSFIGTYRTGFRVTADKGPPPVSIDYPARYRPTVDVRTTLTAKPAEGVTGRLAATSGRVGSEVAVTVNGLERGKPVALSWVTAVGTRARESGWALATVPLRPTAPATVSESGSLATKFRVPDDLGGWHALQVSQGGKVKIELAYHVLRSVVGVKPRTVKQGETFTVHIKGVGWTELDNGFAVVYDNGYVGYACGFYSRGDVAMKLVATGGPGTHIIDVYPMLYKTRGTDHWQGDVPFLSYKYDYPGLALGYRLPAIRLAIKVVK